MDLRSGCACCDLVPIGSRNGDLPTRRHGRFDRRDHVERVRHRRT
jgi:hypothetical protein